MVFMFSAKNENGTKKELLILPRNQNENWLSFSAKNESDSSFKHPMHSALLAPVL